MPQQARDRLARGSIRHLVLFTDGSGGIKTADRRIHSCGWGVCVVLENMSAPEVLAGLAGALPLNPQTVPLSELHALMQALLLVPSGLDTAYPISTRNGVVIASQLCPMPVSGRRCGTCRRSWLPEAHRSRS